MIPSDEVPMFKHLMFTVDPIILKKWVRTWFEEINRKQAKDKASKSSGGGITSWFFGRGSSDSKEISE